ncbi:MAG: DUF5067 domain-containing protein [Microbacterium sp.]
MNKLSVYVAVGALALALTGCAGVASTPGEDDPASTTSTLTPSEASPEEASSTESSFVDNVLTTPEFTIKITSYRVIPVGQAGNEYGSKPVIAFWYDVTNLTDADIDPMQWLFVFTAVQDNDPNAVNELQVGGLPDVAFLDTQTQTIKKGGTVSNAVAYDLDDETTPVELIASDDFGMTEIGRITFNLQ